MDRRIQAAVVGSAVLAQPASGHVFRLLALGYLACDACLLYDQVSGVALYNPFELRVFMAGNEEEPARVVAHAPVDLRFDRKLLGASGVGAFTDVDGLQGRAPMPFL